MGLLGGVEGERKIWGELELESEARMEIFDVESGEPSAAVGALTSKACCGQCQNYSSRQVASNPEEAWLQSLSESMIT